MFYIILACISGGLLVACIMVAVSKERRKRRSDAAIERLTEYSLHFDEERLLRNRSERAQDW